MVLRPPKRQHLFGSASSLWIYNWIQGRVWCACVVVVCDVVRRRNRKEKSFDIIRLEFSSSSRVIPSSHIPLSLSFQRFQLPVICPFSLLKTTTTTPFERETTADAGALFPFFFCFFRLGWEVCCLAYFSSHFGGAYCVWISRRVRDGPRCRRRRRRRL